LLFSYFPSFHENNCTPIALINQIEAIIRVEGVMEYWSVYDINRQKTSQIKLKGESFEKGEFHQVVHCSIINEKNELLIQLRHPNKKYWSGLWDITCGGSSLANET
jgi:hypothetical protein